MDITTLNHIQNLIQASEHAVDIIAVTKTRPFSCVKDAYDAGVLHIGENRVEEAAVKIQTASELGIHGLVWHMIGHVQSRKVKRVVELFDCIDSVDSVSVATAISLHAGKIHKHISMLLEVNISGESTKQGFALYNWGHDRAVFGAFLEDIKYMLELPNISIDGFMIMPPYVTDATENAPYFRSVRALAARIRTEIPSVGAVLSMGTSCDYTSAIVEGSTQIRLGETLFGQRTSTP